MGDDGTLTVGVTATGLPDVQSMYGALVPKGGDGTAYAAFAVPFPEVASGSSTFTLTAKTVAAGASQALVRGQQYEVLLWKQHSDATPENVYGRAELAITEAQWDQLFPPAPVAQDTSVSLAAASTTLTEGETTTLTASVSPSDAAGTVTFANGDAVLGAPIAVSSGKASIDTGALAPGDHTFTAVFTPSDEALFTGSTSAPAAVSVTPAEAPVDPVDPVDPATPKLSVSPNAGLKAAGDTVTVKGEGYNPEQSIYVFLCADIELPTDLFQHAMGCRTGSKQVKPEADGTFELEYAVKQLDAGATAVFTAANHTGMTDRSFDAKVLLDFAKAPVDPATPKLSVSPNAGLKAAGDTVTVKGEGYNPEQSIYVFLCADIELPTDLFQHAMACRTGSKQVKPEADGTFELEYAVKQLDAGATAVFTAANHTGMTDRSFDAKVLLDFAKAPVEPATPKLSVSPNLDLDPSGDTVTVKGEGY
ncbi:Ig-like domain repeat protein, partial [Leucobacter chinensis]|uniref:Ig-like domain repeat protein n=1 Tax=Leucobacter chinensis TaxID=2851010 RepID=UPI001C23ED67